MKRLASLLLIILLLSITSANAQTDITVPVKEGSFLVKDISFQGGADDFDPVTLYANVVNNTSKDWGIVAFEVHLYNKKGKTVKFETGTGLDSFSITIPTFREGETTPFPCFKKGETTAISRVLVGISTFRRKEIANLGIYLKSGAYLAKYFFTMVKPTVNDSLVFDTNAIKIRFLLSPERIGFHLQNKTEDPITIDWNKVSYVDVSGESHRVIHAGVRYLERDRPQAPTIVPPTARVEDDIIPVDYVISSEEGGWDRLPFFKRMSAAAVLYKGKSFSIFMPLEINGVVKNYLFTFTIQDVEY